MMWESYNKGENMMKLQFGLPLVLVLAMGCNEGGDAVDLEAASSQSKWGPTEAPEQQGEFYHLQRAGHLIKAHRAVSLMTGQAVVNPFSDPGELDQSLPNCVFERSVEIQAITSSCDTLGDFGYVIELDGCELENGNRFEGTITVTTPALDGYDPQNTDELDAIEQAVMQARSWQVDLQLTGAEGTDISACGEVHNGVFRGGHEFEMTVSNPYYASDEAAEQPARYYVDTVQRGRNARKGQRSRLILLDSARPDLEINEMEVWSSPNHSGSLLPNFGRARVHSLNGQSLFFSRRLSEEDTATTRPNFHHTELVEIPVL
jgi:hypothetical protein